MQTHDREIHATTVTRPTAGDKVETLKRMINRQRFHLETTSQASIDYQSLRRDLENLEAMLLDYQPENRRRAIVT